MGNPISANRPAGHSEKKNSATLADFCRVKQVKTQVGINLAVTYTILEHTSHLASCDPCGMDSNARSGISAHGKLVTRMGQNTATPFKREDCTVKLRRC